MIHSSEVAEQLKRALAGEVTITLADPEWSWARAFAGDVSFMVGDWRVTFFNDCDELDYTDRAEAPDGRKADRDDWCREAGEGRWQCPLSHLSLEEQARLESMLEQAA